MIGILRLKYFGVSRDYYMSIIRYIAIITQNVSVVGISIKFG